MTRPKFAAAAGFGAVIVFGLVGLGCSSSNSSGGTGGATGTGGTTGTGGHAATGGTSGGQGGSGQGGSGVDAGPALPMCASPAPADKSPCDSNPSCAKACGLNLTALTSERALKGCTCSGPGADGGMWSCPSAAGACIYPTDVDLTCFHLPSPLPLCPHDTADGGADAGSGLLRPGISTCTPPSSEVCGNVCGSATAGTFSYQDSTGAGKVGYCACVSGLYQCASTNEWPPQ